MKARGALRLHTSAPVMPAPPIARGRLLYPDDIAAEFFRGRRTPQWVRAHVPHKIRLGHSTVVWWESDVIAYFDSARTTS